MNAATVRIRLRALADPARAALLRRYFKTGPGDYGEGDVFLGIRVPDQRKLAREFGELPLREIDALLQSEIHEERLVALLILVRRFQRGDEKQRRAIYRLYMRRRARINNWDLVDVSAGTIVGGWLEGRDRSPLDRLARSRSLFDRRIAIMATFHFVRRSEFGDTLRIARLLMRDPHDLIHKATGWMLREIGNRDRAVAEAFVREHLAAMPRTMLRYAIEKYPERLRRELLRMERGRPGA